MSSKCPVCLFTATNVTADQLRDWKCWNCGRGVDDHDIETRKSIAPDTAYGVDPNSIGRFDGD